MRIFVISAAALALASVSVVAAAAGKDDARIAEGKQVFDGNCAACHGPGIGYPGFQGLPGTEALTVKYKGEKPALLTQRTDLTPEVVAYFVRNGVSAMAPYRKTEISDDQLAALGAYLSRNNPDLRTSVRHK